MILKFKKVYFLILLLTVNSCISPTTDASRSQLKTDTSKLLTNDKIIQQSDSETIAGMKFKKLTPEEEFKINSKIKFDKEIERKKNFYGEKYNTGKEIEIVDSKIIYNSNYEPILVIKLKNNLKFDFIALEIDINPSSNCKGIVLRKKVKISPNEIILIREKLDRQEESCSFDDATILLGNCILSNGDKIYIGSENDFFRDALRY